MLRVIEHANPNKITELFSKIHDGIISMILDYNFLYNHEELDLIRNVLYLIDTENKNKKYSVENIYKILSCEDYLKPLVYRCWEFENKYQNGKFISWFKNDTLGDMPQVISSTFSSNVKNTFCNARYGIQYDISIDGFLGACNKDAATIIEDPTKASIYTIGKTAEGKVINSYNLSTPIITPAQVLDTSTNEYRSKHNEVILDSRYIQPVCVIYTSSNDLDIVNNIASKYNIPTQLEEVSKRI